MGVHSTPERRSALRLLLAGAAALVLLLPGVAPLAAAEPGRANASVVTVGSHYDSDPGLTGFAALLSYCNTAAGTTTDIHADNPATFQDAIESYLRGTPETVVTWFAGASRNW